MIQAGGTITFDNSAFGGNQVNYTPSTLDMPDYPWEPEEIISHKIYTSAMGELWSWTKYQKRKFTFHFHAVGTDAIATLGSIAIEEKDFTVRIQEGATEIYKGTFYYTGQKFSPREIAKGVWDFEFECMEVHAR